jgi:HEXXH motif-containing protein
VRGVAAEAAPARHVHADLAVAAYRFLAEMESSAPDEVDRVLRYPAVGAWAWRTYRSLRSRTPSRDDPGRLAALALVIAIRSRTPCRLGVPIPDGTIMLPSLGEVVVPEHGGDVADVAVHPYEGGAELRIGGSAVSVDPSGEGPGWRPLVRLPVAPGFGLVLDDLDSYRWSVREVVEPRLPRERHRRWRSWVREAWEILTAHHRNVAEEVAAGISVLTPIRGPAGGQDSASSRDTFGSIALSEPLNGVGLAATFAHEIQHAKLTALTDMADLTLPDDGRRFYAPWRDDPRPVYGLLQGAYAYLGVAQFWRRQRRFERDAAAFRAQVDFARWRAAAYLVTGTLMSSGRLNERGETFVRGMRRALAQCLSEPVEGAAAAQAAVEADRHAEAWRHRNA